MGEFTNISRRAFSKQMAAVKQGSGSDNPYSRGSYLTPGNFPHAGARVGLAREFREFKLGMR